MDLSLPKGITFQNPSVLGPNISVPLFRTCYLLGIIDFIR